MAGTKTLTIIKPGAVSHEYIGPILARISKTQRELLRHRHSFSVRTPLPTVWTTKGNRDTEINPR